MAKHLLSLKDLSIGEIQGILTRAQGFRDGDPLPRYDGKVVCNMFFEPSTRTQYSFNFAEEKLCMRVISFNPGTSSLNKNESFYDTIKTFDSFGTDVLVIRHSENEYYNHFLNNIKASVINGGDGTGNHPTQSLLDLLTIQQEFGGFAGLKCAIIGDICHSRVAHTNYEVMTRLGMEVVTSGPDEYCESRYPFVPFEEAVETSDIVMMLRVQHERHLNEGVFSADDYREKYGLTARMVGRMKKNAIIMHPAPVNRNVEIADEIVEHEKSRIFRQIENGVFVRMAALERTLEG